MLGATLKRLGCCGVLVWLMIGAVFATFFIGEYLERPESQKSIWKAGVTVSKKSVIVKKKTKKNSKILFFRVSGVLVQYLELELASLLSYS